MQRAAGPDLQADKRVNVFTLSLGALQSIIKMRIIIYPLNTGAVQSHESESRNQSWENKALNIIDWTVLIELRMLHFSRIFFLLLWSYGFIWTYGFICICAPTFPLPFAKGIFDHQWRWYSEVSQLQELYVHLLKMSAVSNRLTEGNQQTKGK